MIWLFLILLLILVALLERFSAERAIDHLDYSFSSESVMVEPDQVFSVDAVLENRSILPVLFLWLAVYLPASTEIHEEEGWKEENVHLRPGQTCVEQSAYLLPRRRRICRVQMSLPERGWYPMGGASLAVGDFLGLRDVYRTEETSCEVVVIPARVETPEVLRTLGGFLGDISVRRFILEDPVLTVGFREYTGREPMKTISWKQTARMNRMMVRQYDYTTNWNVTVVLNVQNGSRGDIEQCYRLTRTVCEELERRGIPFAFETNADLVSPVGFMHSVAEGLGKQHLNTILYGLGRSRCVCRESWQQMAGKLLRRKEQDRSYILITAPMDGPAHSVAERLRSSGGLCVLVGREVDV